MRTFCRFGSCGLKSHDRESGPSSAVLVLTDTDRRDGAAGKLFAVIGGLAEAVCVGVSIDIVTRVGESVWFAMVFSSSLVASCST